MNELIKFYDKAKERATNHMRKGQLNAYYKDLTEMHYYKRLIEAA
ncbi:MAG: hypothetical protein WBN16_07335 [Lutimonas sp.]